MSQESIATDATLADVRRLAETWKARASALVAPTGRAARSFAAGESAGSAAAHGECAAELQATLAGPQADPSAAVLASLRWSNAYNVYKATLADGFLTLTIAWKSDKTTGESGYAVSVNGVRLPHLVSGNGAARIEAVRLAQSIVRDLAQLLGPL